MYSALLALGACLVAQTSAVVTAFPSDGDYFALRTTSNDTRFDNLCVSPYPSNMVRKHRAGFPVTRILILQAYTEAQAKLSPCRFVGLVNRFAQAVFFHNDTGMYGNYYGAPSPVKIINTGSYDQLWRPVRIDETGTPTSDYTVTAADGITTGDAAGFIACYWSFDGQPELFWVSYQPVPFPDSCAIVNLYPSVREDDLM